MILSGGNKLHTYTWTNALVNNNKRCSIYYTVLGLDILKNLMLRAIIKTGEVCYWGYSPSYYRSITDGRGFIVVYIPSITINIRKVSNVRNMNDWYINMKKAKHLKENNFRNTKGIFFRSYNTRNEAIKKSDPGQDQDAESKDFESIIKHWVNCFKNKDKIFSDCKGFLKRKSIWFAAFIKIMKNRGSKTVGPDGLAVNTLTRGRIMDIQKQVLNKTWIWNGVKRIKIPKKIGTRTLGIPSINDRLVQEVLKTIIEPIYESSFVENSFGFRPNRSCHTALKYINTRMKDSIWIIEGDIKGYFDNIDHATLMAILKRRIKDPLILDIINKGLKCKIFEGNYSFPNELGTPQGGILSPLLSNIYLHEFDLFMDQLNKKYQGKVTSKNRRVNPAYTALKNRKLTSLAQKRRIPRCDPSEKEYITVKYVRYADDFIIGVNGPRKLASDIKTEIAEFLKMKLKLTLHEDKTKITHISKGVKFLGHIWSRSTYFIKQKYAGKLRNRRMQSSSLKIEVKGVIEALRDKKFCDGAGKPIPYFKNLRLPQSQTNLMANTVIRGLCNWWVLAANRRKITSFAAYIIRYSIAKMYAGKFRMGTVAKVFKTGSNDLSKALGNKKKSAVGVIDKDVKKIQGILYDKYYKIPKRGDTFLLPDWKPEYLVALEKGNTDEIITYLRGSKSTDSPLKALGWRIKNTLSRQGASCEVCGSFEDVQMHHSKPIRKIKTRNNIKKYIQAIETPQVPLCRKHHLDTHRGNWKNDPIPVK